MFFYEVSDQVMFFHGERFCPFWRITRNGISLSCFPLLVSYFLRNLRSSSPTGIGKKDTEGRFHTISVTRLHIYREGLISGRRSALRLMWISNKVVFNVRVIVLRTYARLIAKKKKKYYSIVLRSLLPFTISRSILVKNCLGTHPFFHLGTRNIVSEDI